MYIYLAVVGVFIASDNVKPIWSRLFFFIPLELISPFISVLSSAFVMTCRPPLYMGPEYIKYFSDKTIDVSITPQ